MNTLKQAIEVISDADCVLIGAGAGLSAAAGLDYTDTKSFAERFPGMLQYGASCQYQLMGYPFLDEALKWGYQSAALDLVYRFGPSEIYQNLKAIVGDGDYFAMTSNVDRFFHKNGFDEERIYTPQGDYEWLQCLKPCTQDVWDAVEPVKRMLESLNPASQRIEDSSSLPNCPNCGGPVFMNVRGGHWFIEERYRLGAQRLHQWLNTTLKKKLAIIEIGSGFNTPSVIRWPLESFAQQHPDAVLIRINKDHAQAPQPSISLSMDAAEALAALCDGLQEAV